MRIFPRRQRDRLRSRPSGGSNKLPMTYYRSPTRRPVRSLTDRPAVKKGRRFILRLSRLMALAAVVAVIILSLMVDPKPKTYVDNQTYRSDSDYKTAVELEFSSLKSRSKLTLNQKAIKSSLKSKFPEISEVNIVLPLYSRTPQVKLSIAVPSFFISGAAGTYGGQSKYIVAANGKAVGLAERFPKITQLPLISDQSSLPVIAGEIVLGQGTSSFILAVIAQCQKANVPIASFNLPAASQEIDLKTSDRQYLVKFNLQGDPAMQIGQFLAAREQFDKAGEGPKEYLDVRVEGRVYYK